MSQQDLNAFADWLVANQSKKGTPEYETVASAFRELDAQSGQRDGALAFSVDQAQRMAGKGIEAVGNLVGSQGMADVGTGIVEQQQRDIAAGGYQPTYGNSLTSYIGTEDFFPALGEKVLENMAPGGAAIAGTGAATLAAIMGAPITALGIGGATLGGSVLMETGASAEEQEERTGEYDPATAAAVGVVAGILDKVGAGKVIPKDKLAKMTVGQVAEELAKKGKTKAARDFVAQVARSARGEGLTEVAQEGLQVAGAMTQGGDYTAQELVERGGDAFMLGGTMGGGTRAAIDTAGALGNVFPKGYQPTDNEAAIDFANRLQKIAGENDLNLKDIKKTSTGGAREAIDMAHKQLAKEMKQLVRDLRQRVQVTDLDTVEEVVDKVSFEAGQEMARNKTKNTVGKQEMDATQRLVGDTREGQQLLRLMRQTNELTRLHNEGYQGGVSQYTDQVAPFSSNVGYTARSAAELPTRLVGTAAGSMVNPLLPAAQVGAVAAGRGIDALTGRRSIVNRYVRQNQGEGGVQVNPDAPSLRDERRQEVEAAQAAAAQDQQRRDQARARTRAMHRDILNSNTEYPQGSPQQIMSNELGLSPQQLIRALKSIVTDPTYGPAARSAIRSLQRGGRIQNVGLLIKRLQREMAKATPPATRDRPIIQGQLAVYEAQEQQRSAAVAQGIRDNQALNDQLQAALDADNTVSEGDRSIAKRTLEKLRMDLTRAPLETAEAYLQDALNRASDPGVITKYVLPYVERVRVQQNARAASEAPAAIEGMSTEPEINQMAVPDFGEGQSVFPVPPKLTERVIGVTMDEGDYRAMPQNESVTGQTFDGARVYINDTGRGGMEVDADQQQDAEPSRQLGRRFRTNLVKKHVVNENGNIGLRIWNWAEQPDGNTRAKDDQESLVAFEQGKDHFYTLNLEMNVPTELAKDQGNINAGNQPYLRPRGFGQPTMGKKVGSIRTSQGKVHPVYDTIRVEPKDAPEINQMALRFEPDPERATREKYNIPERVGRVATDQNLSNALPMTREIFKRVKAKNPTFEIGYSRGGSAAGSSDYLFINGQELRISDHSTGVRRSQEYFAQFPDEMPPEGPAVPGKRSRDSVEKQLDEVIDRIVPDADITGPEINQMSGGPALFNNNVFDIPESDYAKTNLDVRPTPEQVKEMREGTFKPEKKRTLVEAAQHLQDRYEGSEADVQPLELTEENLERIAAMMATEAAYNLEQDGNAIGWYDRKLKAAKQVVAIVEPRVLQSPEAEQAFDFALAVTSNGQAVADNFEYALEVFRYFMDNGVMPTSTFIKGGERNASMVAAFDFFNQWNASGQNMPVGQFLDNDYTVRALIDFIDAFNEANGTDISVPSSEGMNEVVKGSYILGPKIGQGFYQNIRGNYDPLTMDIWWMRMWNRLTGRPFEDMKDEATMQKNRDKIERGMKDTTDPAMKQVIKEALQAAGVKRTGLYKDPAKFDEFIVQLDKAYQRFYKRYKQENGVNHTKPALFKATGTHVKNMQQQLQAQPKGPGERSAMRRATKRAIELLQSQGYDINTADFQALMWYPEKQLFRLLGVAPGRGADNDYLDAAKLLAEKEGKTYEQIQEALPAAERDGVDSGTGSIGQDGEADRGPGSPDAGILSQLNTYEPDGPSGRGDADGGRSGPVVGSRPPTPTEVQTQLDSIEDALYNFEPIVVGAPGTTFETGLNSIEAVRRLATVFQTTLAMVPSSTKAEKIMSDIVMPEYDGMGSNLQVRVMLSIREAAKALGVRLSKTPGTGKYKNMPQPDPERTSPGAGLAIVNEQRLKDKGYDTPAKKLFVVTHEALGHTLEQQKLDEYKPIERFQYSAGDGDYPFSFDNTPRGDLATLIDSLNGQLVVGTKNATKRKHSNTAEIVKDLERMYYENFQVLGEDFAITPHGVALYNLIGAETGFGPALTEETKAHIQATERRTGKDFKRFVESQMRGYFFKPEEQLANGIAFALLNPRLFKQRYPAAYSYIKELLATGEESKHRLNLYAAPFSVLFAAMMAMFAVGDGEDQEEDMDPGALSMGAGALTA